MAGFQYRALFEDHVIRIAKWIKERFPKVQPIIWDDMMRKWSPEEVINSGLGAHVIPMVWVYTGDVHRDIQSKWWLYSKTFQKVKIRTERIWYLVAHLINTSDIL